MTRRNTSDLLGADVLDTFLRDQRIAQRQRLHEHNRRNSLEEVDLNATFRSDASASELETSPAPFSHPVQRRVRQTEDYPPNIREELHRFDHISTEEIRFQHTMSITPGVHAFINANGLNDDDLNTNTPSDTQTPPAGAPHSNGTTQPPAALQQPIGMDQQSSSSRQPANNRANGNPPPQQPPNPPPSGPQPPPQNSQQIPFSLWTQTISYSDIKDLIPSYAGDPTKLEQYISTADTLYLQLSDDHNRKLFLLAIRSKLKDRAFDAIKSSPDPAGWRQLRQTLREKIAPVSPEHAYTLLGNARQSDSESINDYANRIEAMLTTLNRATADPAPSAAREHIRTNNARLAKKSFEYGLANTHIRTIVISAGTASLAHSTQLAMELEATNRFSQPPKAQQGQSNRNAIICDFCQKRGHTAGVCRKKSAQQSRDTGTPQAAASAPAPTQSSPSPENFCRYCKKRGHLINECRKKQANEARKANSSSASANTRKAAVPPSEPPETQLPQTFTLEDLRRELAKN